MDGLGYNFEAAPQVAEGRCSAGAAASGGVHHHPSAAARRPRKGTSEHSASSPHRNTTPSSQSQRLVAATSSDITEVQGSSAQQPSTAPSSSGAATTSNTHNSKSFTCPTCGGQFSRQAILNEHIRAEHLQERVKCTICGMPFKRQNDRRRHETFQHLRKRAFQCKNGGFGCGKRFTRMDSLREHQANPKKAGTTCEQAMLFAKAAPQQQQQQQQPPPPLPPSQPQPQPQPARPQPPAPLPTLPQQHHASIHPPPPGLPLPPPPQTASSDAGSESYITSLMPTLDTSSVETAHDLVDAGLSPSVASDSKAQTSEEHKRWLHWQMDLPARRTPDPSMMPSNISWPSIPEARLRHEAADHLAAIQAASLTSAQEMAALQAMVDHQQHQQQHHQQQQQQQQQQQLMWNMPGDTGLFDDGSGMWASWWLKAGEMRDDHHQ